MFNIFNHEILVSFHYREGLGHRLTVWAPQAHSLWWLLQMELAFRKRLLNVHINSSTDGL